MSIGPKVGLSEPTTSVLSVVTRMLNHQFQRLGRSVHGWRGQQCFKLIMVCPTISSAQVVVQRSTTATSSGESRNPVNCHLNSTRSDGRDERTYREQQIEKQLHFGELRRVDTGQRSDAAARVQCTVDNSAYPVSTHDMWPKRNDRHKERSVGDAGCNLNVAAQRR